MTLPRYKPGQRFVPRFAPEYAISITRVAETKGKVQYYYRYDMNGRYEIEWLTDKDGITALFIELEE